ncbi:NADH:flavin oxidoreductase [uncultured Stenotrophomonas sp.]|uniref:NADH:flavin oxidoreductase n=1 Tax=uncultured Stenotrophomonas sp. TaxID=165438 RepID=UPI0026002815|nr:NADH:flavin oxidoreductase [uncultured Stenotrophomonas sp.]
MNSSTSSILSPFDMKGLSFRNRLAVSPMARVSATAQGVPTGIMEQYYERYARGGFGLIISEGLYTDEEYSLAYPHQPGVVNDQQAAGWSEVIKRVHANGALMFAQIMHAGALAQGVRLKKDTLGPSAIQPVGRQMPVYYGEGEYQVPREITESQIADAIAGFVDTAKRAVQVAGFDGVEIHAANGYLLDQFLTPRSNARTDRWGGELKNRIALSVDVIKEVRQALQGTVPVGVRVSQGKVNDFKSKWTGGVADAEVIFGSLVDAGADYLHVTEFEAWAPAFDSTDQSLARLARRFAPNTPLIVNGSLHTAERAEQALADGADIVALGRGALANPAFPSKISTGQPLSEFDPGILGPIANIKPSELNAA